MADSAHYVIRGGIEGRERLHVLARVMRARLAGEPKPINPITMENIAAPVLSDGLATRSQIDAIVRELYDFAAAPESLAGTPRVVQVWANR